EIVYNRRNRGLAAEAVVERFLRRHRLHRLAGRKQERRGDGGDDDSTAYWAWSGFEHNVLPWLCANRLHQHVRRNLRAGCNGGRGEPSCYGRHAPAVVAGARFEVRQ